MSDSATTHAPSEPMSDQGLVSASPGYEYQRFHPQSQGRQTTSLELLGRLVGTLSAVPQRRGAQVTPCALRRGRSLLLQIHLTPRLLPTSLLSYSYGASPSLGSSTLPLGGGETSGVREPMGFTGHQDTRFYRFPRGRYLPSLDKDPDLTGIA